MVLSLLPAPLLRISTGLRLVPWASSRAEWRSRKRAAPPLPGTRHPPEENDLSTWRRQGEPLVPAVFAQTLVLYGENGEKKNGSRNYMFVVLLALLLYYYLLFVFGAQRIDD